MLQYFKESFRRKKARRFTMKYSPVVEKFNLEQDGVVEFANWDNPLVNDYEITQSSVNFFRKFIKFGDLVIDIGANIGDTTVPMALAAGKDGLTLGFDPSPYVFDILKINSTLNREKTNIVPFLNAITPEVCELYYVSSEASFSNGVVSPTRDSSQGKFVYPDKVKGIKLYDLLKEKYPDWLCKLSFIKIDTEGFDKEIIKSIANLVKDYRPTIIAEIFEYSSDEEKKELFRVVDRQGYHMFYFDDFVENPRIQEIKTARDITAWKKGANLVATPKDS